MTFRIAAVLLFLILGVDGTVLLSVPSVWMVPLALAGWYAADMASGVVHMYMDYRPSRPGIGLDRLYFYEGSRESADYLALRQTVFARMGPIERLTYDFKNHHPRPDALGRRSMLVQIGPAILFTTLPAALVGNAAYLLIRPPVSSLAFLVSFLIGATFAQYFHGTLHRADVGLVVRTLRRLGLLMPPQRHHRHHETLACDFSTINGWSNMLLNAVFRGLRRRGYLKDEGLIPS